jgi:hypothetical protein
MELTADAFEFKSQFEGRVMQQHALLVRVAEIRVKQAHVKARALSFLDCTEWLSHSANIPARCDSGKPLPKQEGRRKLALSPAQFYPLTADVSRKRLAFSALRLRSDAR